MDPQIESDISGIEMPPEALLRHNFGMILLTGASGMLGGYILESLIQLSKLNLIQIKQVIVPVRTVSKYLLDLERENSNLIKLIPFSEIDESLEGNVFNTIFHFSSPSSIFNIKADYLSVFETNFLLTIKFCAHLRKSMGKIFFASSGEVYGKSAIFPTTENDYSGFSHLEPSGLYAESKRAAESYLYAHSEKYGYDVNSLRIYHTFGPGLQFNDKRIFGEVIQSIIFNTPFKWTSNGSVTRNFLYTLDLVRAILILAPTQGFEVFNVAGTQETKILDFVNIARQLSSSVIFPSVPPNFEDVGHTHIHRGFASIDKLASLNWQPTVNIDDAIKRTVRSQKWRISNNYTNL